LFANPLVLARGRAEKEAAYMEIPRKELEIALAVEKRTVSELRAKVAGLKDHVLYLMLTRKKS
jgi:hypothetical protein